MSGDVRLSEPEDTVAGLGPKIDMRVLFLRNRLFLISTLPF